MYHINYLLMEQISWLHSGSICLPAWLRILYPMSSLLFMDMDPHLGISVDIINHVLFAKQIGDRFCTVFNSFRQLPDKISCQCLQKRIFHLPFFRLQPTDIMRSVHLVITLCTLINLVLVKAEHSDALVDRLTGLFSGIRGYYCSECLDLCRDPSTPIPEKQPEREYHEFVKEYLGVSA